MISMLMEMRIKIRLIDLRSRSNHLLIVLLLALMV